ncbi:manganese-dependent inorganic pyrophosphatase [Budviciaceae bacterium BWR-B9]|uniref:Manganese-dependent inorganic pyrophosphatase n=1 Tax=Limnobaculum allomyrinae TaxID=2791986 RepID=A0ABS1IKH6_9GAMM|nr:MULTISPECIES: manganese-dependent inorganic pyrophosphatase [Limnobaculum]MBK5142250.1 manganese-dependent inorganic pyrophosphatase [Limnobaculum allomyrinae]MBV7690866.1 manganese-dependent inorganic pyrophosphatase [Limnobaculum sp. M2-1]
MISVFGHLNPDSDSVCCAIVVSNWLNVTGRPATAYRLGELNPETEFILSQAQCASPPLLEHNIANQPVWLVDFSDLEQGPENLNKSQVIGLIDHHRLGSLITTEPLDAWIRRVGCCATLVFNIVTHTPDYQLSPSHALLLLGAILSDTVAFQSPTTTEQDKQTAHQLSQIANVDLDSFTIKLLDAKTDISGLSIERLLQKDEKNYQIGDYKLILGQIEVSDFYAIENQLPALQQEIEKRAQSEGLNFYVLMITSLSGSKSRLYFSQNNPITQSPITIENMLSRKKQLVPWLTQKLNADK